MVKFKKSNRKHKKYMVVHNGKEIHFGDTRYQQYEDKTGLNYYSYLDHGDDDRRESYRARARGITNKLGQRTYNNPAYANYWSYNYLW